MRLVATSEIIDRIIRKGYAAEAIRGVKWTAPLRQRMEVNHYEEQREFTLESVVAMFNSELYNHNLATSLFRPFAWFMSKTRKRRRKYWRQLQRRFAVTI